VSVDAQIGERLRTLRKQRKWSQERAAEAAGIRREMWSKYESGAEPGAGVLAAIAAAGFDVVYLLTGYTAATQAALAAITRATDIAMSVGGTRHEEATIQEAAFSHLRSHLPAEEQLLLTAYRAMDDAGRKQFLAKALGGSTTHSAESVPSTAKRLTQSNRGAGSVQVGHAGGSVNVTNQGGKRNK